MEKVWRHVFHGFVKVVPEERPVLLTHSCGTTWTATSKTAEILFEGMGVRHFHFVHEAVLPLYAAGQTTGVVVSAGHDNTHVIPIHEGFPMEFAMPDPRYNIAGRHIQECFTKMLTDRGFKVCVCVPLCTDPRIFSYGPRPEANVCFR
jgi:actin-related protein